MAGAQEWAPAVASLVNEGAYAVLEAATKLEKEGKNIVHFEIGQPDYPTPPHVVEAGIAALHAGKTTYCNPSGTAELKEAIAARMGATRKVEVTPAEVVIGPGCKPGIFFAYMALLRPGDEVIFPDPGFPAYSNLAKVTGATPVPVRLNPDNTCFDPEALAKAFTANTRAIIVNSPSNPTGGVATEAQLMEIAELVKKWPNVWVFSDEIYSELVYAGGLAPSFLTTAEETGLRDRTVVFDGASKSYCMTGWRLGWAIMPPPLAERVHLLMVHTIGCSANFTQVAGAAALTGPRDGLDAMLTEYRARRDYVCGRLNDLPGVTCATPAGAFYAFPNVTGSGLTCEEFASRALAEAGVAILPGTDFGAGGAGHIRISYVRSMEVLKEGLDRLEAFVVGLAK